jgi:hypothetical protein
MTISDVQRQHTEARIRAASDRLLSGATSAGSTCDVKTLAAEAGVSRAALYRTYPHLKEEFTQRLTRLRSQGHLPDPRDIQIARLKAHNARLKTRIADLAQQIC